MGEAPPEASACLRGIGHRCHRRSVAAEQAEQAEQAEPGWGGVAGEAVVRPAPARPGGWGCRGGAQVCAHYLARRAGGGGGHATQAWRGGKGRWSLHCEKKLHK